MKRLPRCLLLAALLAGAGCGEDGGAARPCAEYVLKSGLWHYELPETVAHGDTIALAATYGFGPSLCHGYDHTDLTLSGMGCTIAVWGRFENCGGACPQMVAFADLSWRDLVPASHGWYRVTFDAQVTVRDSVWVE